MECAGTGRGAERPPWRDSVDAAEDLWTAGGGDGVGARRTRDGEETGRRRRDGRAARGEVPGGSERRGAAEEVWDTGCGKSLGGEKGRGAGSRPVGWKAPGDGESAGGACREERRT